MLFVVYNAAVVEFFGSAVLGRVENSVAKFMGNHDGIGYPCNKAVLKYSFSFSSFSLNGESSRKKSCWSLTSKPRSGIMNLYSAVSSRRGKVWVNTVAVENVDAWIF